MSSVVISGDTSGAITLAAPAVSGTNTITLPAVTGTVMVSGNMPAFSAYASASQTITLATNTKVAIDTEVFDTNSNFDTTTNRFTPNVAGYYQVTGMLRGSCSTTFVVCNAVIFKNGSGLIVSANAGTFTASSFISPTVSTIVYMNGTTDYLELYGNVSGTGTATFNSTSVSATSQFSACLVRAA